MSAPRPQPIAHLAWQQTPARARRVAQALCLRHGERVDAQALANALKLPVELILVYLAAAHRERNLRNVQPREPMSSTMIAHAMSAGSRADNSASPAAVRRYLADPSGVQRRESDQRSRLATRNGHRESTLKWPAAVVLQRILEWRALYGTWPSGYDWTRAHAARRGGNALTRWSTGHWPDAQTVRRLFHTFPMAASAARDYAQTSGTAVERHPV